jgi:methylated-DNA-[protein]-cysteine S-methyltransferase
VSSPAVWDRIDSPIGPLSVAVDRDGKLVLVRFGGKPPPLELGGHERDPSRCSRVTAQLGEYFARARRRFDLDVEPGGTEFERQVWREVATIGYGETRSYAEVAARIGGGAVARAVGMATAANPVPIVIPCHRVIGADGGLVGYGGGLEVKAALLRLEGARLAVLDQMSLDL